MNKNPNYFGKVGFTRPPNAQIKDRIINVGTLNNQITLLLEKKIASKEGKLINLDLEDIGYDKILGKGKLDYQLVIKAKKFSKQAVKKIVDAGGQVLKPENQ